MAMRISGLMSGMDTETIISQLVEAKRTKVNKTIKAQKSLKYKQDAWKTLNTQIKKLHTNALSNLRFESSFIKKTTKVSNSNIVSVITGENAMNSVQNLTVTNLAKSGYLTSGDIRKVAGSPDRKVTGDTTLSDLGFSNSGTIRVDAGDEWGLVQVSGSTTVNDFVAQLKEAGVNANFDEANGRIHVVSKSSGVANDFEIYALNAGGSDALDALKMSYSNDAIKDKYNDIIAKNQATLGSVDANNSSDVENFIAGEQQKLLVELLDERTKWKNDQKDAFDSINNASNGWGAGLRGALRTELQANPDLAGVFNADGTINYDQYDALDFDKKEEFNAALNDAINAQRDSAAGVDKDGLDNIFSVWNEVTASLEAVESRLDLTTDPTNPGLNDGDKNHIANRINTAVKAIQDAQAMLDKMNVAGAAAVTDGGQKQKAEDAEIELNGVTYTSDKNTFQVNGLTLTVNAKTAPGEEVTITTQDDTDGIYDMIKNFFKEYNALINQMDKLYGAESAKGYDPLLDEEKDAMSDSEIEEWETKIKDSILRKDSTLSTFASEMKRIMMKGAEVDGKKMYLSNFGINTLSYFIAPENEKNAYHIDGDTDDSETAGNADVLKSMIANDPDTVVAFFTQLSKNLYNKMSEMMGPTEYSSAMTAYDDKKMKEEYDNYTSKIKDLEKKLADYEDKWYAKFAAMETALAKMQQNASAVTALLGGGV